MKLGIAVDYITLMPLWRMIADWTDWDEGIVSVVGLGLVLFNSITWGLYISHVFLFPTV